MFKVLSKISCPKCGQPNHRDVDWLVSLDDLECDACGNESDPFLERSIALQAFLENSLRLDNWLVWVKPA